MMVFVLIEAKKDKKDQRRWCDIQKGRGGEEEGGQKFDKSQNKKIHMKER